MGEKVKIEGVTKAAFDAVKGVVHFNPDYTEAACGAAGRKFSDFIGGVTCKRCLAANRVALAAAARGED